MYCNPAKINFFKSWTEEKKKTEKILNGERILIYRQ